MGAAHEPGERAEGIDAPRLPVSLHAERDPVAARLALLQAGGNRALARWLAPRRQPPRASMQPRQVQRVGGWTSAGASAKNRSEGTFSGIRRVPIEGLSPVARALVLVPPGLDATKPVDVLLHLHGANVGYDEASPRDLDATRDRLEEQLSAAKRPQLVAILAQGSSSNAYLSELGKIDPKKYSQDALNTLATLDGKTAATVGRIVLSGHSGGGFAIKTILDDPAKAAELAGVVWMDAIQAESGKAPRRFTTGQREAAKKLAVDRISAELATLQPGDSDDVKKAKLTPGFQFRVYYDDRGGYKPAALEIEAFLQALFGESGTPAKAQAPLAAQIAALPKDARDALRARYRTIPVPRATPPATHDANIAAGQLDTLGHDNMVGSNAILDALTAMPFGQAPAAPAQTQQGGSGNPPPATGSQGAAPKSSMLDDEIIEGAELVAEAALSVLTGGIGAMLMRDVAPEDVPARLIDETVSLGHADGDPPGGRTLLRRDDVRAMLSARSSDAALNATFDATVAALKAKPQGPDRDAEYKRQASGMILELEDAWIRDPSKSAVDLLPPARAAHFRAVKWGKDDYPGNGGPLGFEAVAMASELSALRPERRPNAGGTAVISQAETTDAKRRRIAANLSAVKDQKGAKLFAEAARSFELMAEMAAYDGITLTILSSWRDPAVAAANAAKSGNPMAVASFSSHSLGLAVDIQMAGGGQHFLEMTTHPMGNVFGMRSSQTHKWMLLRAEEFGWFPYGNEPWHWEYNPPGFRDRFRAIVDPPKATPAAKTAPAAGA